MKRALIQNIKVYPYTSGEAIDRERFLPGVLAVKVGTPTGSPTGLAVKVTLTESDTADGTFTPASDKLIPVGNKPLDDDGSISIATDAQGGALVNLDLDLVGCKKYIKAACSVVCTGGTSAACTATAAVVLGDAAEMPV